MGAVVPLGADMCPRCWLSPRSAAAWARRLLCHERGVSIGGHRARYRLCGARRRQWRLRGSAVGAESRCAADRRRWQFGQTRDRGPGGLRRCRIDLGTARPRPADVRAAVEWVLRNNEIRSAGVGYGMGYPHGGISPPGCAGRARLVVECVSRVTSQPRLPKTVRQIGQGHFLLRFSRLLRRGMSVSSRWGRLGCACAQVDATR